MNTSNIFNLNLGDIRRGIIVALFTGLVLFIAPVLLVLAAPGFDVYQVDWTSLLHTAINSGIAGFAGYIIKNLFTDSSGKFLGILG